MFPLVKKYFKNERIYSIFSLPLTQGLTKYTCILEAIVGWLLGSNGLYPSHYKRKIIYETSVRPKPTFPPSTPNILMYIRKITLVYLYIREYTFGTCLTNVRSLCYFLCSFVLCKYVRRRRCSCHRFRKGQNSKG